MARTYKRDKIGRFAGAGGGGGGGAAKKPAAKKPAARKPAAKKPAAKKAASKKKVEGEEKPVAAKKPAAKKTTRKPAAKKSTAKKTTTKADKGYTTKRGETTEMGKTMRVKGKEAASGTLKGKKVTEAVNRRNIKRAEARIKSSDVENSYITNRFGKRVGENTGTANKVSMKTDRQKRGGLAAPGQTLTHNHPSRGNENYAASKGIRGRELTAGLSAGDYKAGGTRRAREVRAVGETRAYSFKPELVKTKQGVQVKQRADITGSGRDRFSIDVDRASGTATYNRGQTRANIAGKFDERISAQRKKWWNPAAQMKANKISKMKERSMKALSATENFQQGTFMMREMRKLGYNVTAKRNRKLVR